MTEGVPPVLIVEDDPGVRRMIQWALEDAGLAVRVARDGAEGLEWAQQQRPALVVLDMALPRLNGDGFAAGLRGLYGKDVPIVVVTADGRAADKARRVGAVDFVQKPFDVDALVDVVQRELKSA